MAHTVESLAKLLKRTTDEVIVLLSSAGINSKKNTSEISVEERKLLMQSISNKKSAAINLNIKPSENKAAEYGVKVKVKVKRTANSVHITSQEAERAKYALDEGHRKTQQEQKQEQERKELFKKITAEKATKKNENTANVNDKKAVEKKNNKDTKKPQYTAKKDYKKAFSVKNTTNKFSNKTKHKLKKRDKTKLSQKLREEQQHAFIKPVDKITREVEIPKMIKVADLALKMTIKVSEVLKVMMSMGVMATINDTIDQDTAVLVVEEMGHTAIINKTKTIEDSLVRKKDKNIGEIRAPIVTIMGHVDHGKTSLLDYIRSTKVTNAEAGGITQHIGAYQVKSNTGVITFIDTPGHAAFSKMRKRGVLATDIVILVVAADDGVMPQTIQSIKYAKEAQVPIIVAINKIDKEGIEIDKVKQMLSNHDVIAEDWGGDVIISPVSAKTGAGIDDLLDNISLTAEMLELRAEIEVPAEGVVLEARIDKGIGKIANILIQDGSLKKGDIIVAGLEYGKVKKIIDSGGNSIKQALPSMPVEVLGLSGVPVAGENVVVVDSERKARGVVEFRRTQAREKLLQKQQSEKMENFLKKMENSDVTIINIMIKADVYGSIGALNDALEELSNDEVKVKIIASGVGAINSTDVVMAQTADAIIFGFNVRADSMAKKEALTLAVKIEYYSIIYNLIDDVKALMSGYLKPELSEKIIGIANVKDIFKSQKFGDVAGCIVTQGVVRKDSPIRVLRNNIVIYEGELESLKRFKDNVAEVKSGTECGIAVLNYTDVKAGDQIEVFERIETAKTL